MCVCYWQLVCGVFPNYEVVDFQPRTVTPPEPRLRHLLLCIYSLPAPPCPPLLSSDVLPGGADPSCPDTIYTYVRRISENDDKFYIIVHAKISWDGT